VSSLGGAEYRHDEWGADVTVAASQKGLMLPPGIGFNALSAKALAASKAARLARSYWSWDEMLAANKNGFFAYTPNTNLLQGLKVAIALLHEEGLDNVFARHQRAAEATRRCVARWGLELQSRNPAFHSPILTAVRMPRGHSADRLRSEILSRYNMALGSGLGELSDLVFRIGHLGDFHDLMVTGTLTGIEMGFKVAHVPHRPGGVEAAMTYLAGNS
jgi:alanine-glyoxylate transaminase/serine-glyoxylate transaminase/serine-pyruvate transaminase